MNRNSAVVSETGSKQQTPISDTRMFIQQELPSMMAISSGYSLVLPPQLSSFFEEDIFIDDMISHVKLC